MTGSSSAAWPPSWTVVSWNVHGSADPDVATLAAVLRERAPDVVAIQEIKRVQAQQLATALGMRHRWARKHFPYTAALWWRAEGMAILSPHVIVDADARRIGGSRWRWNWTRRIAQWATIRRLHDEIRCYHLHLSPHEDAVARQRESELVARIVAEHAPRPDVVIVGDLNHDEPTMLAILPVIEPVHPSPTNPADSPHQVLDHVLVPASAVGYTVTVPDGGPAWAARSDHLPVTATFRLA